MSNVVPTADDLALAREIYDREIALPKAPMSGSIDRIASLIAKHRQTEQSDERNLWNILDELQNALNILWRKGDGIPAFLEVQRKLHVWAREHYAKHRQPPPAMTIEEQMAEIDEKLATTPGIKFHPLKKLFTAKAPKGQTP